MLEMQQWALYLHWIIFTISNCLAWLPDSSSKLLNTEDHLFAISFFGNTSYPDHFTILKRDESSLIVGGRNTIYNLSVNDLTEKEHFRMLWPSSEAHSQLCTLKGKSEDDCQNYIRILVHLTAELILVCGTNSFKPLCRQYSFTNDKYKTENEIDGIGLCPYDPEHNSTALYSKKQLYSATVADFSGGDPLIYRKPQRTERSDLKQLNAPNFVSSISYGDYIFFFYRETAVEYINCGKVIYSRVARVCRDDRGGPHQFGDRWTSFLKARLNCSVPGEYPFYFDEIQSTSDVIDGNYANESRQIVYGTLTTPNNAIGGSAICAYDMRDIIRVFQGSFKHQENMNSNWLPVSPEKIPLPRPGQCVKDSRILPENGVNFIKTHSLMEDAVPALFGQPILIRVSLEYRFNSIIVDPQIRTADDTTYDVLYVGTDNGKVLKIVNIPKRNNTKAVVISENIVYTNGAPVKQLKLGNGYGKVIAVSRDEIKLIHLNHCHMNKNCHKCIALQDPHCAWDTQKSVCVSLDAISTRRNLIQDVLDADTSLCDSPTSSKKGAKQSESPFNIKNTAILEAESNITDPLLESVPNQNNCQPNIENNEINGCAITQKLVIYTAETLHIVVIGASLAGLFVGFITGYLFSKRLQPQPNYPEVPFIEQHNHLERLGGNTNGYLTPRANKTVNLVVNVPPSTPPPPKKDNLETTKDLNIASDGTLQKIKKTYI